MKTAAGQNARYFEIIYFILLWLISKWFSKSQLNLIFLNINEYALGFQIQYHNLPAPTRSAFAFFLSAFVTLEKMLRNIFLVQAIRAFQTSHTLDLTSLADREAITSSLTGLSSFTDLIDVIATQYIDSADTDQGIVWLSFSS